MREGGDRGFGRGDGTFAGQYRDVLVRGAPRSAQVREAEAVDVRVAVGVAPAGLCGVRARVGTPLEHAERDIGTGELSHGARAHGPGRRAVERMDEGRRVSAGGQGRLARRGPKRKAGGRSQRAQDRQQRHGDHERIAPAPAGTDRSGHVEDRSNGDCGGTVVRRTATDDPCRGIRGRVTTRWHARHRGCMADGRGARARLRDDGDRPLQRRSCLLRAGLSGGGRGGQELVGSHRPRPRDSARGDRGPWHFDRAGPGRGHAAPCGDLARLRRRCGGLGPCRPPGRDEARLRPDHLGDAGPGSLRGGSDRNRDGAGPCSMPA